MASGVAYAVEHNLGLVAEEGVVQMLNFATEESNTEALQLLSQILYVARCIDGHRRE